MTPMKLRLKAACRLRKVWLAIARKSRQERRTALARLLAHYRDLKRACRWFNKVLGWRPTLDLPCLREDVLVQVKAIQEAARQVREQLEESEPTVPDLAALMADFRQLEDEFENLAIDCKARVIRVTTEPITLEGVFLGPFTIELRWDRLTPFMSSECFAIVAVSPHPADRDESVTHPHVKDQSLCAGDATSPLQKALEQGRLADAFCLIKSVLTHYNPRSPHVRLENWNDDEDIDCHECGCSVRDDNRNYCESCNHDYCDDCSSSCNRCSTVRCHECLSRCAVCEEYYCGRCLKRSAHSGRDCCSDCIKKCASCETEVASDELSEETDLCPACRARSASAGTAPHPSSQPENNDEPTREPASLAAL